MPQNRGTIPRDTLCDPRRPTRPRAGLYSTSRASLQFRGRFGLHAIGHNVEFANGGQR